jgi:hypothetical protein
MGRHQRNDRPWMCVRCGSPRVVDFAAETVCADCGADTPGPEPEPDSYPGPFIL